MRSRPEQVQMVLEWLRSGLEAKDCYRRIKEDGLNMDYAVDLIDDAMLGVTAGKVPAGWPRCDKCRQNVQKVYPVDSEDFISKAGKFKDRLGNREVVRFICRDCVRG